MEYLYIAGKFYKVELDLGMNPIGIPMEAAMGQVYGETGDQQ